MRFFVRTFLQEGSDTSKNFPVMGVKEGLLCTTLTGSKTDLSVCTLTEPAPDSGQAPPRPCPLTDSCFAEEE